jgi:enoyl-CoA hydratase/carnithine racemase/methionyl-tRNA formyltransferase
VALRKTLFAFGLQAQACAVSQIDDASFPRGSLTLTNLFTSQTCAFRASPQLYPCEISLTSVLCLSQAPAVLLEYIYELPRPSIDHQTKHNSTTSTTPDTTTTTTSIKMKILFLCTAHNSLSQRLYLALSRSHKVTVEYALSDEIMLEAVALSKPDLVICPFLTTFVPKLIYDNVLCLIIHPGPPGDAGPSSLDWLLFGDDGTVEDPAELLAQMDKGAHFEGRSHWGVTVLQADEQFDAGPVWAFQQFPIEDLDEPTLTKSSLYRGNVTRAAIIATMTAVQRIESATSMTSPRRATPGPCSARLVANPEYARLSVSDNLPFQGGPTHARPLFKASYAAFDTTRHTAQYISRRIRCADSQPGVYSNVFGPNLYLYGGMIDVTLTEVAPTFRGNSKTGVLAVRDGAVCIAAADGKGVWVTHIRRPKTKSDKALWPKVPAVLGLMQLGVLDVPSANKLSVSGPADFSLVLGETLQETWVDFEVDEYANTTAYLYFEHYNGATSTDQCSRLIEAMDFILKKASSDPSIRALVMMGGSYFSNGIALNVAEAASDPAQESWLNINRIDDVVHHLLHEFPSRNITTIAAVRGNAAAGGVALATACDFVIAGSDVVLNPAYRGIGLYGSEFHSLSYYARCGEVKAKKILTAMLPLSPLQARQIGLVDFVFPGSGDVLDDHIQTHVTMMLKDGVPRKGLWKRNVDLSPSAIALARANELAEMSKDFWSTRAVRYHSRRSDFVRKAKPTCTPLRFALHRRIMAQPDEEETPEFDDVEAYRLRAENELIAKLRSSLTITTGSDDQDGNAGKHGINGRVRLVLPPNNALTPPDDGKAGATLFSCHYDNFCPVPALLTPPESPMPAYLPMFGKDVPKATA